MNVIHVYIFFQGLFITATALAVFSLGTFAWYCFKKKKNLYITSLILAALSFIFGLTTLIIMRVNLYDPYCGATIADGNISINDKETEDSIGIHLAAAGTAAAGAFALLSFVLYKNDAIDFTSHAIQNYAAHNVGSLLF